MSYYSATEPMSSRVDDRPNRARARLQEAKKALYREAILAAAEAVFAEHGYEAAKVQAIAELGGVSLATFYATFPKKWDVYRALQSMRLRALMQEVGTRVMQATDTFERLRCGIEGYLRFHMAHPAFLRLQLRERVPWGTTDELRTPEQTRAWESGLQMLMAAFRDGIREGLFVAEDPELCARTATAMSQVRLALWVDGAPEARESPDVVAHRTMQQFIRAFASEARRGELLARLDASPWSPASSSALLDEDEVDPLVLQPTRRGK